MNVMLFSRIVAKSGVGNHMKQLSEELVKQGHAVTVVSSINELDIGGGTSSVDFICLPPISLNPIAMVKGIKNLHDIIKRKQIQVVHCHHRMAALYMKLYRVLFNIPVVYTLHLADIPSDYLHKKATYAGDKAIGVSTEVSDFLVEKLDVPRNKVITICNGVDEKQLSLLIDDEKQSLHKNWSVPIDSTVFVMHSRIDEVKNHLLVVNAVKEMPKEYRDKIVFLCSGTQAGTYYEKVKKTIKNYDLEKNFIFTGWIETRKLLGIADALVLPSTNEGFPLSVVEAFLMKIPVLRTRTGGFDDQKYCIEISKTNAMDVAYSMMSFVDNKDDYKKSTEEAFQYAMNNFTIERMTEKTVEVYSMISK